MRVDMAGLLSLLTVIAGVVILLAPQTLNYILALYLIVTAMVGFGFAGKGLWPALDALRAGPRQRGGFIPVKLGLMAEVKYFGRHKGSYIRDGVILSLAAEP